MKDDEFWRKIELVRNCFSVGTSWVLFEGDTCVKLVDPKEDLSKDDLGKEAIQILSREGAVLSAGPLDFEVFSSPYAQYWVVLYHNSNIVSFVSKKDAPDDSTAQTVGTIAKMHKDSDAHNLKISHIDDGRND